MLAMLANVGPLLHQIKTKDSKSPTHSFIPLFMEYTLCAYSVPGMVLGSGDKAENNKVLAFTDMVQGGGKSRNAGIPYFFVFNFVAFPRYCFKKKKLKACGNPVK